MNYLAHAYFSFNNPPILLGNMISDYVKGKRQYEYPSEIQKGIKLHRLIDTFTDEHIITKEIKKIFTPSVRLYSGAFVDVVYDHFLATNKTILNEEEWLAFTKISYDLLADQSIFFPEKFARMFPYMQSQNWLFNYRYIWGIENSFGGLVRRAKYLDSSAEAFVQFNENYSTIEQLSEIFLSDIQVFAKNQFQGLMSQ